MNKPEVVGWDEIRLALGEQPTGAPIFTRVMDLVDALVKQSFPQWIAASEMARAMGLPNPEQAKTQDILAKIGEWRKNGGRPTTLSAHHCRTPSDPRFDYSEPGPYSHVGLETSALAQALGLDANTPKAAVLAEISRLANELWPGNQEEAEYNRRMRLLGYGIALNASLGRVELVARPRHAFDGIAPEYSLRGQLAQALINPSASYAESKTGWAASQLLSEAEVLTLSVQMVAAKRAAQSELVLLHAANTGGTAAAPAWKPELETLTAKMPAGTTISIGPSISLAKAAAH